MWPSSCPCASKRVSSGEFSTQVGELHLEQLSIRDFRNLSRVDIEPASRVNVIAGNNGHGKTSLLEAIYFASTSKSFRTHRMAELVRHGAQVAHVRAHFREFQSETAPMTREQSAAIEGKSTTLKVDGNRPQSLSTFATRSPVVVFHPEEMELSTGPAGLRRRLLDRVSLYMDPASADRRARYEHALRARQGLLQRRSSSEGYSGADLDAFEALCAKHGAELTQARKRAAAALESELFIAFSRIAAPELKLSAHYEAGGSEQADEALHELQQRRARDALRPSAGYGPHRDDWKLHFGDHPARLYGSQGQHRALTLAIKIAEASTIAQMRGLLPILLLDDVSSELDPERTRALFEFLAHTRSQIFLTTTRPELIVTPSIRPEERADIRIENGKIAALPGPA